MQQLRFYWFHYRLESVLKWAWAVVVFTMLLIQIESWFHKQSISPIKKSPVLNFDSIGQGPFALNPHYLNPRTPKLLDSLFVICGSKMIYGEDCLHLGIMDSPRIQKLKFHAYNPIHLEFPNDHHHLLASWMIKPLKIQNEQLIIEAKNCDQEEMILSLPIVKQHGFESLKQHKGILSLQDVRFLGVDQLLVQAEKVQDKPLFFRLLFDKSRILSLKEGDLLYFRDGKWSLEDHKYEIVAQFHENGKKPYLIITDRIGFHEEQVDLKLMEQEVFLYQQLLPHTIKVYPDKKISCFLGKQKMFLKTQDWVLKTGNYHQVLKSTSDIKALIDFEKMGPLMIIDEISIHKTACFVRGKIFSPLRMNAYPFEKEADLVQVKPQQIKRTAKRLKK